MELQSYLALKNGSDVRGVALEGVINEPVTLTENIVEAIARAFCLWLQKRTPQTVLTIAIGFDSRLSATKLCDAAIKGIVNAGHNVILTGLSTTPSMFMLLKDEKRLAQYPCHGSIMLTASHLPFNRNGLKFFTPNGGIESADVTEILQLAYEHQTAEPVKNIGECVPTPYLLDYAANLVALVRQATDEEQPLLGKRIVVDAGNGAGGFFVENVLQPLGADTTGSQFLNPDGNFPNHIPNPENKEAMRSVCEAVKKANADFGIIFDTDVDRAGAVDADGNEINRNRLIALISAVLLKEKKGTIVTDSVTSDGLAAFIQQLGGTHHRFKRGYKNVINEAIRLNDEGIYTPLAIETSGHAALKENYFLDDGAYLVTRLLIALANSAKQGRQLTDLINDLKMPQEEKEIRLRFRDGCDFKTVGATLIERLQTYFTTKSGACLAPDNHEGCRICFDKLHGEGWALVRMSLHDPLLAINAESDKAGGCKIIVQMLYDFFKDYQTDLDISPLKNAMA